MAATQTHGNGANFVQGAFRVEFYTRVFYRGSESLI